MVAVYVPRIFGGTIIPSATSTVPTLIVMAVFRSGTVSANYRSGQQTATYRDGVVRVGGR